jgi:hypothetical protein
VHGDALKVRVAAPPVDGEANHALLRLLARRLGVAPSQLRLVSGETGRTKVIDITGPDVHSVREALTE